MRTRFSDLPLSLFYGGGGSLENSNVNLTVKKINDTTGSEESLATLSSSLNVMSLCGVFGADFKIGSFVTGLSTDLLIPLFSFSKGASGETNLESGVPASDDYVADLDTAVKHDKSSFGLDLLIFIGVEF